MKTVYILVEGQTEETFVKKILVSHLQQYSIFPQPVLMRKGKGGHEGNYYVIQKALKNLLYESRKDDSIVAVTTLIDLYGLPNQKPNSFPGINKAPNYDCFERAQYLEQRFATNIYDKTGKFLPNLVIHEFESLLFSSPDSICEVMFASDKQCSQLHDIVNTFESPEQINDSIETAPSKRLEKIFNQDYYKRLHGFQIAEQIGLKTICEKCTHFARWLKKIESL